MKTQEEIKEIENDLEEMYDRNYHAKVDEEITEQEENKNGRQGQQRDRKNREYQS